VKEKTIVYLSEKEEEFITLLTRIGMQKNMAKVLVFLVETKEATSRMIERGADLRQPEVSVALSRLGEQGWVTHSEIPSPCKGRPNKLFRLAVPLRQILGGVEEAARKNIDRQLGLAERLRTFV
jgi:predicted transcriptional regulator